MLIPNGAPRRKRNAKQSKRSLKVESLEHRRLLSADGVLPEDVARLIAPGGFVSGTKWEDINADGRRGPDEVGLAGVTIYADANGNGRFDRGEQSTTTAADDPDTRVDESGTYNMWVSPGRYTIREVVPEGYAQTFPLSFVIDPPEPEPFNGFFVEPSLISVNDGEETFHQPLVFTSEGFCDRPLELQVQALSADGSPEVRVEVVNHDETQLNMCDGEPTDFDLEIHLPDPDVTYFELGILDVPGGDILATVPVQVGDPIVSNGGHQIEVEIASRHVGLDFGNTRIGGRTASIEGRAWSDQNGNGVQDAGEAGLGGVEVYLDRNNNGFRDRGEPATRTQFEDPVTDFDEGGLYNFSGLKPGKYTVREVVPEGYVQTYPTLDGDVLSSETGRFKAGNALDFDLVDVSYDQANDATNTTLTLSAQWPNGCGFIDSASQTVIGNTILVDVQGGQRDGICTEALIDTEIEVSIQGLNGDDYSVVATLHEGAGATLGVVGEFEIGIGGAHYVDVAAGEISTGADFGNRRTGQVESIGGVKWHDLNGDGHRQRDEPGLAGVTIYVDANHNQQLDKGEISAVSKEGGEYELVGVEPGYHEIREVVPEGYRQTFPHSWFVDFNDDPIGPDELIPSNGSHFVELLPGSQLSGINFGNQSTDPSSVSGTKWHDVNGNGVRDEGEEGLAGVTIYVDINSNGTLDKGEPNAVSNEVGEYKIGGIRPGFHSVLEVVPEGYHQTYPRNGFWFADPLETPFIEDRLIAPPFQQHFIAFQPGTAVEGIDFGNQKIEPGSISGIKWNDINGNGIREPEEAAIAGVTIYIDQNYDGQFNVGEPSTVTAEDNPDTDVDETGRYRFGNLEPLNVYAIREVIPEGFEQTFPQVFDWPQPVFDDVANDLFIIPWPGGTHNVYVESGQNVEQINFGNRKTPDPAFINGTVWVDANGNGQRDADEGGHAGVQVFVDSNLNGRHDWNELQTTTQTDNPETDVDETGQYSLKVRPGSHLILQSVPPGAEQTSPNPNRELIFPFNRGTSVDVESGESVDGIDFGNRRGLRQGISGTTWFDHNANGVRDRGEEAINSVTVYLDQNDNGRLDRHEQSAVSGVFNGPGDVLVAAGSYNFDVAPGDYIVRQVVPRGYIGTYPALDFELGESASEPIEPISAVSFELTDISSSASSANDTGQADVYLKFQTVWAAADAQIEVSRLLVDGDVIEVELTAKTKGADADVLTIHDTVVNVGSLELLDMAEYQVVARLHEAQGDVPSFVMESQFFTHPDNSHRVSVSTGEYVEGLNFGSIATPQVQVDSEMGEDPHSHQHDRSATPVEFHNGHVQLNSYVDENGDLDVFRFIGNGDYITGEIVGERVTYEILDDAGNAIAMSTSGEPVSAATVEGETYYVRVSGAQGQYQLDLLQESTVPETQTLPGDTDADGDVDFQDFLVLSMNFGQEVDAAFADADFDADGTVSFADFLALSQNFGSSV